MIYIIKITRLRCFRSPLMNREDCNQKDWLTPSYNQSLPCWLHNRLLIAIIKLISFHSKRTESESDENGHYAYSPSSSPEFDSQSLPTGFVYKQIRNSFPSILDSRPIFELGSKSHACSFKYLQVWFPSLKIS